MHKLFSHTPRRHTARQHATGQHLRVEHLHRRPVGRRKRAAPDGKNHLSKSHMKAYLSCEEGYRVPQALKWQVVTCTCAFRASRRSTYSCSAEELSPCKTVCEFETVHGLRLSHAGSARRHLSCASLGQQGGQRFVYAAHIAAWATTVILTSSLATENPSKKP